MRVQNVQFYNPIYPMRPKAGNQSEVCDNVTRLDTSIYAQKGVNVSFGKWNKGSNKLEQDCIDLFRGIWDGKKGRKYDEYNIEAFMANLKEGHDKHDPLELISAMFDTFSDAHLKLFTTKRRPEAESVNAVLKLTKGMDENEYFDVLTLFAHDLESGEPRPLVALASLPEESRAKIMPFVGRVNRFDFGTFKDEAVQEKTVYDLYEDLRHLIYSAYDEPTATPQKKLDNLAALRFELKKYRAAKEDFLSDEAHSRFVGVLNDMYETLQDILLK